LHQSAGANETLIFFVAPALMGPWRVDEGTNSEF